MTKDALQKTLGEYQQAKTNIQEKAERIFSSLLSILEEDGFNVTEAGRSAAPNREYLIRCDLKLSGFPVEFYLLPDPVAGGLNNTFQFDGKRSSEYLRGYDRQALVPLINAVYAAVEKVAAQRLNNIYDKK